MKPRDAGFTVIEVLMAVAIMGIALSGIALTGIVSMQADRRGHLASAATSLAQAKLDQLRNTPRDDPEWSEGAHQENGLDENGNSVAGGPFQRRWNVDLDYNSQPDLARITVDILWNDGGPVTLSALYW